jgi:hypothetical protein
MILHEINLRKIIKNALIKENIIDAAKAYLGREESGDLGAMNFEFQSIENSSVVTIAEKENKFWQNGKLKENDKKAYKKLKEYWDNLSDSWPEDRWSPDTPWSAAFVSYCNKKSGESFYDSAAHTTYATKALKNREEVTKDPSKFLDKEIHVLFLKGEAEPSIGDGLFYLRQGDLSSWIGSGGGQSPSHTDIFIGNGMAIGGNLSNSCVKTKAFGKHEALIKKIKVTAVKETEDEKSDKEAEKKDS